MCPACRHHLRFVGEAAATSAPADDSPLRVDGTIRHPAVGEAWEYSVLLTVRDARGAEVSRQVVGVGALQPGDERTFSLAVEVTRLDRK